MSVFFITYNNGKKMMTPVIDAKAYLRMRQSEGQRRLTEAAHNGAVYKNKNGEEVSVKTRLQQYNYSCLPNDDGSLAKSQRLSRSVAMDIDYPGEGCGKLLMEWKDEVRDMVMAKKDEVGALMFGDSATKGFHLVFRRHADLSQEGNLRWASEVLGVPFDACAKDHTRVLYEPSGEIYLLSDELFDQSPSEACADDALCSVARKVVHEDKEHVTNSDKAYRGIPFSDIIAKYWEMYNGGKLPMEGDRNVKTYELAMTLRPICDYSAETLMEVIPQYDGFPYEEYARTIENAVKEPRKGMPYRLRQVLMALDRDRVVAATGGTMTTPPPMPQKLPKLIELLTKNVPAYYKPAVASAVFPALGVHLHGVKFRYWDNVEHEATFMNVLIGRQSVGKGCIKKPIEYILADIVARDEPNRKREAEWKRKNPTGKSKAKDPRPADICIQVLIDNLTDAVFNQRIVDANNNGERYVYTIVDEIEALKKVTSKGNAAEVSLLIRKAFDNSMAGQERVGADSVSGIAPLRWNWNASTTPPNARRFFSQAVNDGTISRLDISTIILSDDIADDNDAPVMGIYDEMFADKLHPYLQRLDAASGLVECEQARKLSVSMKKENDEMSRLCESEAYRILSYRANVIAWLKGMVLYIAQGYKWDSTIADFVQWSQRYNLWCKMLYFGQQLEEELKEERTIMQSSGPKNLLDLLPEEFSYQQYEQVRIVQGKSGDGKTTLRVWMSRGYIEKDDASDTYHKTESYLKRALHS